MFSNAVINITIRTSFKNIFKFLWLNTLFAPLCSVVLPASSGKLNKNSGVDAVH